MSERMMSEKDALDEIQGWRKEAIGLKKQLKQRDEIINILSVTLELAHKEISAMESIASNVALDGSMAIRSIEGSRKKIADIKSKMEACPDCAPKLEIRLKGEE